MMRGHVLPAVAAALALSLATAAGSLGASAFGTDISSNWAGYVATGLGSTRRPQARP